MLTEDHTTDSFWMGGADVDSPKYDLNVELGQ